MALASAELRIYCSMALASAESWPAAVRPRGGGCPLLRGCVRGVAPVLVILDGGCLSSLLGP